MKRFIVDTLAIIVASIIVNAALRTWDGLTYPTPKEYATTTLAYRPATTTPTRVPTSTPVPTIAPLSSGVPVIYVFNLVPVRVWFHKEDAIAYREATLDGTPTRPYISLDKSRTVRGGRMLVLKQEDGLVMVKVEDADIIGWMQ